MGKGINSRQKGKRGELEACHVLRKLWLVPTLIRAAQACGAYAADLICALPLFHFEVKRYKTIASTKFMEQAVEDKNDGQIPVVVQREDHGEWLLVIRLEDSETFARTLVEHLDQQRSL